jgi:hypothetical protein
VPEGDQQRDHAEREQREGGDDDRYLPRTVTLPDGSPPRFLLQSYVDLFPIQVRWFETGGLAVER